MLSWPSEIQKEFIRDLKLFNEQDFRKIMKFYEQNLNDFVFILKFSITSLISTFKTFIHILYYLNLSKTNITVFEQCFNCKF